MKSLIALALISAPLLATDPALAQAYRWKDSNGKTVISDTPPPLSQDRRAVVTQPYEQAESGKSYQEKDADFRKRMAAAQEKSEKDAKMAAEQAAIKEDCERHRGTLTAVTSGQSLFIINGNGEKQPMTEDERERQTTRSRNFINKNCM